ncbi:hypothetical protein GH714_034525 [Hevea brasiliensis]|uniref:SAM-dependent MTase RsmB/NOP-type domain-containing protein n=1 Tax=Hevea brasiliensis TaxID=3981 RepID=A0A6A6KYC9_HEVBR|nr:hypothetical protein GH714_034525 [Hevea brasiliensis]
MGGGRGRGKRSRTQRKHFRDGRENVWKRPKFDSSSDPNNTTTNNPTWQPFATQNQAFDEYYKEQGIVAPEEWDTFVQVLRTPLPAAFRINSSSQFCTDIISQLEDGFVKSLKAEVTDGGEVEAIRPLPWFHVFLKLENEIGNITRQEAVSMVPPLFLDVRPHHFVLDSKQLMVIANDLDVQRCNLLIHQTKRMCTANLIVTNNEAQHFPGCHANKNFIKVSEIELEPPVSKLLFDRVLCDVPCSGDGTLRKAPDLWRKLNSGMGNGLHNLQIQIAMRVGGRMVYSTCSMNPVENEAVVGEILRKCEGSVELVDVSSKLPQLVRRPGLRKWKVRDKGIWLSSYKDVSKFCRFGILRSMFPSGTSCVAPADGDYKQENGANVNSEDEPMADPMTSTEDLNEEVSDLPLESCMRIVPHDQNSGAFFIAILHKLSPLPVIQEKPSERGNMLTKKYEEQEKLSEQVTECNNGVELNSEDAALEKFSEAAAEADLVENETDKAALDPDPCNIGDENDSEKNQMLVDDGIPSAKAVGKRNGHLISRNSDTNHVKRIYYISKSVKDVLELNLLVGQQLKISSIGLKMYERQTSREGTTAPCAFRISSEGLPVILPHITKQILYASTVDFKHLLQYKAVKFKDFVDAEFGEKASKLMLGCSVVVIRDTKTLAEPIQVDASTIAIGCWKGRASLSVMVTAIDCQELLERLSARMEIEKDSSVQKHNVEATEVQDMNGIEKVEESKTTKEATNG